MSEKEGTDRFAHFHRKMGISVLFIDNAFISTKYMHDSWLIEGRLAEWLNNIKVNRETIGIKKTIHDLPTIKNSALVIDNPFTGSIDKQLEALKNYKGTVFCCDRALWKVAPYLKNTTGNYVVNVDSSYLCNSFFDRPDVRDAMAYVTAIFSVTSFPLTIRSFSGERCFFTPWMSELSYTIAKTTGTDILVPGGCVHNTSWVIAVALGAKEIGIFGLDNSYNHLRETEYPIKIPHKKIKVKELSRTFYVDPIYEHYAEMLFHFIETTKVKTINVGENGIMYTSVAKQKGYNIEIGRSTLKEFVKTYD